MMAIWIEKIRERAPSLELRRNAGLFGQPPWSSGHCEVLLSAMLQHGNLGGVAEVRAGKGKWGVTKNWRTARCGF